MDDKIKQKHCYSCEHWISPRTCPIYARSPHSFGERLQQYTDEFLQYEVCSLWTERADKEKPRHIPSRHGVREIKEDEARPPSLLDVTEVSEAARLRRKYDTTRKIVVVNDEDVYELSEEDYEDDYYEYEDDYEFPDEEV